MCPLAAVFARGSFESTDFSLTSRYLPLDLPLIRQLHGTFLRRDTFDLREFSLSDDGTLDLGDQVRGQKQCDAVLLDAVRCQDQSCRTFGIVF